MRKILTVFIATIIMLYSTTAFAKTIVGIYNSSDKSYELDEIEPTDGGYKNNGCYSFLVNNEEWFFCTNTLTSPIKYDENVWNVLAAQNGIRDYLWTGEYYYGRHTYTDWSGQSYKGGNHKIYLYDEDLNLVSEYTFSQYPKEIAYTDGVYYVRLAADNNYGNNLSETVMQSADFENWEISEYDITYKKNEVYFRENQISSDNINYYTMLFENSSNFKTYENEFPLWFIKSNFKLSKDGIYSVCVETEDGNYPNSQLVGSYFYEDKYVMHYADGSEIVLSTDEIMEYMSDISVAPYVVYNNEILAFEEPPVIENGTTLIPIRFLFGQMGAEVDWEQDTRTATISKDGTVITFTIDNTTAMVNGEPAEMTLPAQLINDKTMVPVRFLSEELGYTVTWDGDNRIITIE
ncbi:MAG: copper amine oxidase N-terminal domain-containing protein [Oscillospiraceae bacterium]|nr:copper amine oxidase N-terminal domain-containing protein [Oscillospiraceae bacterium]